MIVPDDMGKMPQTVYRLANAPMMTAYKALGFDIKDFPNAYNLYVNEVTLPLHTRLSDEDVEYVIENYIDVIEGFL